RNEIHAMLREDVHQAAAIGVARRPQDRRGHVGAARPLERAGVGLVGRDEHHVPAARWPATLEVVQDRLEVGPTPGREHRDACDHRADSMMRPTASSSDAATWYPDRAATMSAAAATSFGTRRPCP